MVSNYTVLPGLILGSILGYLVTKRNTWFQIKIPLTSWEASNKTKKYWQWQFIFYLLQKEETPEEAMAKLKAKGKKELAVVDHNKIEYLDFKKDFYREVPEITKMTDEEVEAYREEMESIKIKGKVN